MIERPSAAIGPRTRAMTSPSTTAMTSARTRMRCASPSSPRARRLRHQPGRAHAQEVEAPQEDADDRPAQRHAAEIGGVAGKAERQGVGGSRQRHRRIGEDQRPGTAENLEAREGFGGHRGERWPANGRRANGEGRTEPYTGRIRPATRSCLLRPPATGRLSAGRAPRSPRPCRPGRWRRPGSSISARPAGGCCAAAGRRPAHRPAH